MKHCPNCVTEMVKETRKLGGTTKWYKCPSCGVRETENPIFVSDQERVKRTKQRQRDERGFYDSEGHNTY